ncbi:hypothetical protein [Burkholderia phage BCSR52]|jgi:hypothetical protein|uniref:Uncharacterized protein n=1 Tax=Burkholderia phage BCSR52 TaxID=2805748 RepID=A0A889IRN6_9CAUD|nr:hypothetical protein [Burkholderia phage BCSR52]DAP64210.1 MAG TPA: hypothetical protein [Caudoviricetes sp.]
MSKVYIPQLPFKFDHAVSRRVPQFDITPAMQFGQLEMVLDETDDSRLLARLTPKIRERLQQFTENDFMIAIGNPAVIAICASIVLRRQKRLKMLQWNAKLGMYYEMELNP